MRIDKEKNYDLEQLPYPLSKLMQNFLQLMQPDEFGNIVKNISPFVALEGIFCLSRFVSYILLSDYIHNGIYKKHENSDAINRYILDNLKKPSDGHWVNFLGYLSKQLEGMPEIFSVPFIKLLSPSNKISKTLNKAVTLRNKIIHAHVNDKKLYEQIDTYIKNIIPLFRELCNYHYFTVLENESVFYSHGFGPFQNDTTFCVSKGEDNFLLRRKNTSESLSLFPFVFSQLGISQGDIYFYNKQSQGGYHYISYDPSRQLISSKLSHSLKLHFNTLLGELEQNARPQKKEVREDIIHYDHLCEFHKDNFVGRERVLSLIDSFSHEKRGRYGIVQGKAGIGKTAIMAILYKKYKEKFLWHFCSNSDDTSVPQIFFRSLLSQGYQKFPQLKKDLPYNINELQLCWQQFLQKVSSLLQKDETLTFVIDAIDEAKDIAHLLPEFLPENIIGVISVRSDLLEKLPIANFSTREDICVIENLEKKDIEMLLVEKVGIAKEKLTKSLLEKIWQNSQQGDPFYLRFLADALRHGKISLSNLHSLPFSLEDFFDQTWLELSSEYDYLVYYILGVLSVIKTSVEDGLLSEILVKDKKLITTVRSEIYKLLMTKDEHYTLFHSRFRDYVQGKFRVEEIANFHKSILLHYDEKENGIRQYEILDDYALQYLPYHAYSASMSNNDYSSLYDILEDKELFYQREKYLERNKVLLDDLEYGIKAAISELYLGKGQVRRLLWYCMSYRVLLSKGRNQLTQTIQKHIENKAYDFSLHELSLITEEDIRFYQHQLLMITAVQHNELDATARIYNKIQKIPYPELDYYNTPLYLIWLDTISKENIPENIPPIKDLLFWSRLLTLKNLTTKQLDYILNAIIVNIGEQKITEEFLDHISHMGVSTSHIKNYVLEQIVKATKDPLIQTHIYLTFFDTSYEQEDILISCLESISQISSNRDKFLVLSQILEKIDNTLGEQHQSHIFQIIEAISDDAVRFSLFMEFFCCGFSVRNELLEKSKLWLEKTSLQKRWILEPVLLAYNAQDVEKIWLDLYEMVETFARAGEYKLLRSCLKCFVFIDSNDIKQDIIAHILQQIYGISNENERSEILLIIIPEILKNGFEEKAFELTESFVYTLENIYPLSLRNKRILQVAEYLHGFIKPEHQKQLFKMIQKQLLIALENDFGYLYIEILKLLPEFYQEMVLDFLEKLDERYISPKIITATSQYIKNENFFERYYTIIRHFKKNSLKSQGFSEMSWLFYTINDTEKMMALLYKSQEVMMEEKDEKIILPATLLKSLSIQKIESDDAILKNIDNNISQNTSIHTLLIYAKFYDTLDDEKAAHYFTLALSEIVALIDMSEKYKYLMQWVEPFQNRKCFSLYYPVIEQFQNHACNFEESHQKSSLIISLSRCLKTLESEKEATRLFKKLYAFCEENFEDLAVRYRTMTKVMYAMDYQKRFKIDFDPYLEKIWKDAETIEDPVLLAPILRSLRPFGPIKRVKSFMEKLVKSIDGISNITQRALVIKDVIGTLNGITEVSRLERLLGKYLQVLSFDTNLEEKKNRLIELAMFLPLLEEWSHMDDAWSYLKKVHRAIEILENAYFVRITAALVAIQLMKENHHDKILPFVALANEDKGGIFDEMLRCELFHKLALMNYMYGNWDKCVNCIESIPVFSKKMFALRSLARNFSKEQLLEVLPMSIQSVETLDYLLCLILKIYPEEAKQASDVIFTFTKKGC